MRKYLAKIINTAMDILHIAYAKGRKNKIEYPYFVGEIYDLGSVDESGRKQWEILLDGFSRTGLEELETCVDRIEEYFQEEMGRCFRADGELAVIYFATSTPVPTNAEGLYRMEIKLTAKTWKG